MDHEQLASESAICAGVLGRGDEFVLIRIDEDYPGKQEDIECALSRGLSYCGALGWSRDGKMSAALESDPDTLLPMRLAAFAFAALIQQIGSGAASAPEVDHGDSTEWLERLHALPDTR